MSRPPDLTKARDAAALRGISSGIMSGGHVRIYLEENEAYSIVISAGMDSEAALHLKQCLDELDAHITAHIRREIGG